MTSMRWRARLYRICEREESLRGLSFFCLDTHIRERIFYGYTHIYVGVNGEVIFFAVIFYNLRFRTYRE